MTDKVTLLSAGIALFENFGFDVTDYDRSSLMEMQAKLALFTDLSSEEFIDTVKDLNESLNDYDQDQDNFDDVFDIADYNDEVEYDMEYPDMY